MKFDHDILFEFIPEEDKKSFMTWDNVFLPATSTNVSRDTIVAVYRAPFELEGCYLHERIFIPLSEYELRLKQKERNNKLNNLGLC
jgi:hypothetical protein